MKKLILGLALAFVANAAFATPQPIGDSTTTWELTDNDTVLTIGGTGAMSNFKDLSQQPWRAAHTSIAKVIIESGVTSIGDYAFGDCRGLTSVAIPSSVTSIGASAFSYCRGLTSVAIPSSVTSIGDYAFQECSGLTSVTIPSSVVSIGNYAFEDCSGLTSVAIPSSVTSIGAWAFKGCSGLTSVTIPSSVTSIGDYAFYKCRGLTSVTIPSSVTSIGNDAFYFCSSLEYAVVLAKNPPTGGNGMFDSAAEGFVICVPEGSAADYKDEPGWGAYAVNIQEPWHVGDNVLAYVSGTTLGIVGSGAMSNFTSAASLPWVADANKVTAVKVAKGVTLGQNALAGLSDDVLVSLPALPASTSSIGSMKGTMGASEPVIPEDKVLVAKEELQAAKAEAVTVADGVVSLGVTVNTNGNFTAETKDWAPVELKSENVEVKDGKIVISIPVSDKSGFMILQSGDAKVGAASGGGPAANDAAAIAEIVEAEAVVENPDPEVENPDRESVGRESLP